MQKISLNIKTIKVLFHFIQYSLQYFIYIHSKIFPRYKTFSFSIIRHLNVDLYHLLDYVDNACARYLCDYMNDKNYFN